MARRTTFTQAELERAMKAAKKLDREVVIVAGTIRIVAPAAPAPLLSEHEGDDEKAARAACLTAFGE